MDSADVSGLRERARRVNEFIVRSSDVVVGPGTRTRLHFTILLLDGAEVDSTRGGSRLSSPSAMDIFFRALKVPSRALLRASADDSR